MQSNQYTFFLDKSTLALALSFTYLPSDPELEHAAHLVFVSVLYFTVKQTDFPPLIEEALNYTKAKGPFLDIFPSFWREGGRGRISNWP